MQKDTGRYCAKNQGPFYLRESHRQLRYLNCQPTYLVPICIFRLKTCGIRTPELPQTYRPG